MGCVGSGQEAEYRRLVIHFLAASQLILNRTKERIVDFKRSWSERKRKTPLGEEVQTVYMLRWTTDAWALT